MGADKVALPLAELSGGERLKAALACVLWRAEATQLLLLDEPTNHLDLASVQAIEAALAGFPGALLVVSHDDAFKRVNVVARDDLGRGGLALRESLNTSPAKAGRSNVTTLSVC